MSLKSLTERVDNYLENERSISSLIDTSIVLANLIKVVRIYSGWAELEAHVDVEGDTPDITADTQISESEWSIIHRLFVLYVEKEEALHLEASRSLGVELFGRSSSEVAQDILQYEMEQLPRLAFYRPVDSIL